MGPPGDAKDSLHGDAMAPLEIDLEPSGLARIDTSDDNADSGLLALMKSMNCQTALRKTNIQEMQDLIGQLYGHSVQYSPDNLNELLQFFVGGSENYQLIVYNGNIPRGHPGKYTSFGRVDKGTTKIVWIWTNGDNRFEGMEPCDNISLAERPLDLDLSKSWIQVAPLKSQLVPKSHNTSIDTPVSPFAAELDRSAYHECFPNGFNRHPTSGESLLDNLRSLRSSILYQWGIKLPDADFLASLLEDDDTSMDGNSTEGAAKERGHLNLLQDLLSGYTEDYPNLLLCVYMGNLLEGDPGKYYGYFHGNAKPIWLWSNGRINHFEAMSSLTQGQHPIYFPDIKDQTPPIQPLSDDHEMKDVDDQAVDGQNTAGQESTGHDTASGQDAIIGQDNGRSLEDDVNHQNGGLETTDGGDDDLAEYYYTNAEAEAAAEIAKLKEKNKNFKDGWTFSNGINDDIQPLENMHNIFNHLAESSQTKLDMSALAKHLAGRPLRIGTMCSGTEAVLLGLTEVFRNLRYKCDVHITFEHVFSAEIEPFKQAYIQRNFNPTILFRDVTEFQEDSVEATTAYGSRVHIPGNLDVLVVGPSCVDFSTKNKVKKKLEQDGESADTFMGILRYCSKFRPRMIILENVKLAPYEEKGDQKGMISYLEEIGYCSFHISLDTKQFYLPQTRARGYMLCVDLRLRISQSDFDQDDLVKKNLHETLKTWEEKVRLLSRPASVPANEMLFDKDDPSKKLLGRQPTPKDREISWPKCALKHGVYRSQLSLGSGKYLTNWRPGGQCKLPNHYEQPHGLIERTLDCLEIAHLRNNSRGFDDQFYSRTLELSQNVYWYLDSNAAGIIDCVTPRGIPWSTHRGHKLSGLEALKLQGINPVNLDLGGLSSKQMFDLAGNAMSSTVVTAATVAALSIPGLFTLFPKGDNSAANTFMDVAMDIDERVTSLPLNNRDATSYTPNSVADFQNLARATIPLCQICTSKAFNPRYLKCTVCGYTVCSTHYGKPKHHFQEISGVDLGDRNISGDTFRRRLHEALPSIWRFSSRNGCDIPQLLENHYSRYLDTPEKADRVPVSALIEKALKTPLFLHSVKVVQSAWEVRYESEAGILIGIISSTNIQWLLYVNTSRMIWDDFTTTRFRRSPILQMFPHGDDITQGDWRFWLFKDAVVPVEICSEGQSAVSYKARVGLPANKGQQVSTIVDIRLINPADADYFEGCSIVGRYVLSQECGQASQTLHRLEGSEPSSVYLMLDHTELGGDPSKHSFLITNDLRKLISRKDVRRNVFATIASSWRQPVHQLGEHPKNVDRTDIHILGRWGPPLDIGLVQNPDPHMVEYGLLPKEVPLLASMECPDDLELYTMRMPMAGSLPPSWQLDVHDKLKTEHAPEVMQHLSWAFGDTLFNPYHCVSGGKWQHEADIDIGQVCKACVPETPELRWREGRSRAGKKTIAPVEEPQEAAEYEITIKARPSALCASFRIIDNTFQVVLRANRASLIHRAAAAFSSRRDAISATSSWRLITGLNRLSRPITPLTIKDINEHLDADPSTLPAEHNRSMFKYRPEQNKAFAWMLGREQGDRVFVEEEIVEERVDAFNTALWARVSLQSRRRGGIAAFDVGFGKTMLILGLIIHSMKKSSKDAENDLDRIVSKLSLPETPQDPTPVALPSFRIPCKATVVYMPQHLLEQWHKEISQHLKGIKVLTIDTSVCFKKLSVKDILNVDIILVNYNLGGMELYKRRLAAIAGTLELEGVTGNRALRHWHEQSNTNIGLHTAALVKDCQATVSMVKDAFERNRQVGARFETLCRVRGQANYERARAKRTIEQMSDEPKPDQYAIEVSKSRQDFIDDLEALHDWKSLRFPVLEMFRFSRVVVDEFTYLDPVTLKFSHVEAVARESLSVWILSGTPPLSCFHDLELCGKLLQVHLGSTDYESMPGDKKSRYAKELTGRELFLSQKKALSESLHFQRQIQAQKFLDEFARRGEAILEDDIPTSVHLQVVRLTEVELASYCMEQRDLDGVDFAALDDGENPVQKLLEKSSLRQTLESNDEFETRLCDGHVFLKDAVAFVKKSKGYPEFKGSLVEKIMHYLLRRAMYLERRYGNEPIKKSTASVQEHCARFRPWFKSVQINGLGDVTDTARFIEIHDSAASFKDLSYSLWANTEPKGKCREKMWTHLTSAQKHERDTVVALGVAGDLFIDHRHQTQVENAVNPQNTMLECSSCKSRNSRREISMMAFCGHILCKKCSGSLNGHCLVPKCVSPVDPHQIISFRDTDDNNPLPPPAGTKLESLVRLVHSIPQNEKVIIFVQYDKIRDMLAKTLDANNVNTLNLSAVTARARKLSQFTGDSKLTKRDRDNRVIVLSIDDESAAGSNITVANHVIFVNPYYVAGSDGQAQYNAAMKQAIGRAVRMKQEKHVHIYHYIATRTVDADILEMRLNQNIVGLKPQSDGPDPYPGYIWSRYHMRGLHYTSSCKSSAAHLAPPADSIFN